MSGCDGKHGRLYHMARVLGGFNKAKKPAITEVMDEDEKRRIIAEMFEQYGYEMVEGEDGVLRRKRRHPWHRDWNQGVRARDWGKTA